MGNCSGRANWAVTGLAVGPSRPARVAFRLCAIPSTARDGRRGFRSQIGAYAHIAGWCRTWTLERRWFRPGSFARRGAATSRSPPSFRSQFPPSRKPPGCRSQRSMGRPYGGAAPVGLEVSGRRLELTSGYASPLWTSRADISFGRRWVTVLLHVAFSKRRAGGLVPLWVNHRRQRFANGGAISHVATLVPGVSAGGENSLSLNLYLGRTPLVGHVVVYHRGGASRVVLAVRRTPSAGPSMSCLWRRLQPARGQRCSSR
jgi:hypothetical protein